MKFRALNKIFYLCGIVIFVAGSFPILKMFQQSRTEHKMSYNDESYFTYHVILSIIIFLAGVAGAAALFWFGRRLKMK